MIVELIKLANHLDKIGLVQESNGLDSVIVKLHKNATDWNILELVNHETGDSYFYDKRTNKVLDAQPGESMRIILDVNKNPDNWTAQAVAGWPEQRPVQVARPEVQEPDADPSDISWFEGSREHQNLQGNYSWKNFDISLSSGDEALWRSFERDYGDGARSLPKPPFAPVIIIIHEKCLTENEVRFVLAKITKEFAGREEPYGWEVSWDTNNGSNRSRANLEWNSVLDQLDNALENARGFSYADKKVVQKAKEDMGCARRRWRPFGRD